MGEQDFAYEKTEEGIRILRCYGVSGAVAVPEELEGLPVTELADYAFADRMEGEPENTSGLPCICGEDLEELYLPESIRRLGRYVFYNCLQFWKLSCYSTVSFMGAGGFTGCGRLSHLEIHQKGGDSCLRELLQDLKQTVMVDCYWESPADAMARADFKQPVTVGRSGQQAVQEKFGAESQGKRAVQENFGAMEGEIKRAVQEDFGAMEGQSRQELTPGIHAGAAGGLQARNPGEVLVCRLVYPEFFEEAVENTPARIISTQTHGMGIQYRNTFRDTQIVFSEYDKLFETGKYNMDITTMIEMSTARLSHPYALSERAKAEYALWLREHLREGASYFLGQGRADEVRWLAESFAETREELELLLKAANYQPDTRLLSLLMDTLHRRFPAKKKKFML